MQTLRRLFVMTSIVLVISVTLSNSVFAGDVDDPYGRVKKISRPKYYFSHFGTMHHHRIISKAKQ